MEVGNDTLKTFGCKQQYFMWMSKSEGVQEWVPNFYTFLALEI